MKSNIHIQSVPADVIEQVNAKVQEINGLLESYLTVGLTPRDRQKLTKMGPRTLDFVGASFDAGRKYPKLLPGHVLMSEFEIDYADARQLYFVQESLESLLRGLTDLAMVAGSEALQAALAVYASIKLAADQKVPGTQTVYENLRNKYPQATRRSTPETTKTEP